MIPGIDPKVDYAFKKLFGTETSAPVLMSLLDAILKPPPDQKIVSLEITDPFNEKETPDDKLSIVDVKARDQLGRLYNIEMQMQSSATFPDRALYYWAVLYGQQLREGQDYPKLRPTISISIINDVLFRQVPDYHLDFQLRSSQHPDLIFSDLQSVHVIELPKFRRTLAELVDPLDAWCYFLIHGAVLALAHLPQPLGDLAVRKAMEVLQIMSQSELEWERYQSRLKFQRDQNMYLKDATDKGLKQGLEQGEILGQIHAYQRLLKLPMSPREELLALPLDELRAQAQDLEQQLATPKS
jgi:predicted transposase/invertase (TIGR01784 family)